MKKKGSRILIIDDNPNNLDVLSDLLGEKDFVMLFALDGITGLQRAESGQANLILLDIMMPGVDGFEICRQLKANDKTRDIPVIFMTARTDTVDKVRGFQIGAVDYITKPIEPEEVLARVNTHLTIQKLQNELQAKNTMLADREAHLMHLVREKTLQIENITMALIDALENANALNDEDTGNHLKRIGAYSACIAEHYGCDQDFVRRIMLYAPLHDTGKVGLPDTLLKKPGKYTDVEFVQMQQHVVFGASLLEYPGIDVMAKNIVLYHHEKWDGTGYVNHLAGEDIPLESRIVALADVYDALISKRVYKDAFSNDQAERIICQESGKHFDPTLVDIFLDHKSDFQAIQRSFSTVYVPPTIPITNDGCPSAQTSMIRLANSTSW